LQPIIELVKGEDIVKYQRDGVVCLRSVLAGELLSLLARAIEENAARPTGRAKYTGTGSGQFYNDYNAWRSSDLFRQFLRISPLAQIAAELLRSERVSLYGDHILIKSPGSTIKTDWHQDLPFWRVDGEQVGSFWMALEPVSLNTGALQFVRGSHATGTLYNPTGGNVSGQRFAGHEDIPNIEADRENYDIESFDLQPGDCTFHHSRMLHAASGNMNPDRPRRAFAVRVAGDDAVYSTKITNRDVEDETLKDGEPLVSKNYPLLWRNPMI
jgi:ectoine hydroxylase-related dioxygenase (phytanoyl-CoA dioxygenase family)